MTRGAILAALCLLGSAAAADTLRETERFERKRVSAGEEVARTVDCPSGREISGGGYALYNLPVDRMVFQVTASYPTEDGWRVEIRNMTQTPHPLTFRVYALCESGNGS